MSQKNRLENLIKQLSSLVQNKKKSREQILEEIIYKLWSKESMEDSELGYLLDFAETKEEKEFLNKRLSAYLNDFEFNKSTDLGDLRVIFLLELQIRRLTKLASERKGKIDSSVSEDITKYSKELREVKTKLGISKFQRHGKQKTPFDELQEIKRQGLDYIRQHRDEFVWRCKNCGQMHLLARKHSAFDEEGYIWNEELVKLYNEGCITLEQAAKVLETSEDNIRRICKRKGFKLK